MNVKTNILFLLIICFFFSVGCGDDGSSYSKRNLERDIKKALTDGEGISANEWKELADNIESGSLEIDDIVLEQLINEGAKKINRRGRNEIPYPPKIKKPAKASKPQSSDNKEENPKFSKKEFSLYLENSASMDGYLNGQTFFKDDLFNLLSQINGYDEDVNISFINKKIYPIHKDIKEFIDFLEPKNVKKFGKRNSTKINEILRDVTDTFRLTKMPVILISDYIYSPGKSNSKSDLSTEKYTTKLVFQDAIRETPNCAVLVIKNKSVFNGTYYDYEDRPQRYQGERPYYIWVIGDVEDLKEFPERYRINTFDGYQKHLLLYNTGNTEEPYFSILPYTNKEGNFRKANKSSNKIKSIEDLDLSSRHDILQFSIAVDISNLPVDKDYILNKNNYSIESDKSKDIIIESIEDINTVVQRDEKYIGSGTHVITLSMDRIYKGEQTLEIGLLKKLPTWVEESSTLDDKKIKEESMKTKTFGFEYLIKGVSEAYDPEGDISHYFTFKIKLNK